MMWYWLAINGPTVAAWEIPCKAVKVTPTPEVLLGLRTRKEQLRIQRLLLQEPMDVVEGFIQNEIVPKVARLEARCLRCANPDPPTDGPTLWESTAKMCTE